MTGFKYTLRVAPVLLLLVAGEARAGFCGDDLDGARVACDCGDVVATNTTLRPGDPVTAKRCPRDGLIVRVAPTGDTVTLDLGGVAIVGSGRGTGLLIERGGSDGAIVLGGAEGKSTEIVGFGTGVHVATASAVRRLERIHVKGSRHEGFRINQAGALLVDLQASDNGGDGIWVSGTGGRLIRAVADRNQRVGIRLSASGIIADGSASDNKRHGVASAGRGSNLNGVAARRNGGHGVVVRTGRQSTTGVTTEGNARAAVRELPASRAAR